MAPDLFREKALARISSPEQLDQLMRIAPSGGRWALSAALGVVACALVWGFFGSLPTKVSGRAILLNSAGVFTVTAQTTGKVTTLYFVNGGQVKLGQPIALITQPLLAEKVDSARAALERAREKRRTEQEFESKDLRLVLQNLEARKGYLATDIANFRSQVGWYTERIKLMEPFIADGTIAKSQLFQYQSELADVQEHLSQKLSERQGIDSQILEQQNKHSQQIKALELEIATDEENLRAAETDLEMNSLVPSPYSGRVIDVGVKVGSVVNTGTALCTLEVSSADLSYLEAVLYIPADQGQRVKEGMVVQLSPDTAKIERYGSMLGLVTRVSTYPSSQAQLERTLQNTELVRQITANGVVVEVGVLPVPDHATGSGYKWSSSKGPDFVIEAGTLCKASIIVERQRPISMLVPLFNKYFLGRGVPQTEDGDS